MGLDYRCVHPDGSQADVRDENGHYVVTIDGEQVFADRRQDLATAATFTGVVPLVVAGGNTVAHGSSRPLRTRSPGPRRTIFQRHGSPCRGMRKLD